MAGTRSVRRALSDREAPSDMSTDIPSRTDILILGAGPAGVEAALAARQAGYRTVVLEAGQVGDSVMRWRHVRLFSSWALYM